MIHNQSRYRLSDSLCIVQFTEALNFDLLELQRQEDAHTAKISGPVTYKISSHAIVAEFVLSRKVKYSLNHPYALLFRVHIRRLFYLYAPINLKTIVVDSL